MRASILASTRSVFASRPIDRAKRRACRLGNALKTIRTSFSFPGQMHNFPKASGALGRQHAAARECRNASRRSFDASIPMASLAIFTSYLCLSFGPAAQLSGQGAGKDSRIRDRRFPASGIAACCAAREN
jgi:hypothetical protein